MNKPNSQFYDLIDNGNSWYEYAEGCLVVTSVVKIGNC